MADIGNGARLWPVYDAGSIPARHHGEEAKMEYKIKEKFAPVEISIVLMSGRELANFSKALYEFGRTYEDDYDDDRFIEFAAQLAKIRERKILDGEMLSVE